MNTFKQCKDNGFLLNLQKEPYIPVSYTHLMNLARIGNKYLADTEPWKLAKTDMPRVATILNISLQLVANLAIAFEPFLPFSSERLRKMLNMESFDLSLIHIYYPCCKSSRRCYLYFRTGWPDFGQR